MRIYNFWLGGGHAAVDLVNTLDERLSPNPEECLTSYGALVEFSRQYHLIEDDEAETLSQRVDTSSGESILAAALLLREAVHSTLRSLMAKEVPNQTDIALIEAEIQRASLARRLVPIGVSLKWQWESPVSPDRPLWELALAAEDLFLSGAIQRTRKCGAEDCGTFFVDDSRAGSRRWCSMATCGNRHKVRQFRSTRRPSDATKG